MFTAFDPDTTTAITLVVGPDDSVLDEVHVFLDDYDFLGYVPSLDWEMPTTFLLISIPGAMNFKIRLDFRSAPGE